MRFKEFLKSEGTYGSVKNSGGEHLLAKVLIKQVKSPFGAEGGVKKMMSSGPKLTKPARPAGLTSVNGPLTIPSVL